MQLLQMNFTMKKMYIAIMMALFCLVSSAEAITDAQDVYALNQLYTSFSSSFLPGWTPNGGDPCSDAWEGVLCAGPNVTILDLHGLGLSGAFGPALQNLTALIVLDLNTNLFSGDIPVQYPPHIQQLNMSGNYFSGTIPDELGQLPLLSSLDLSDNALVGELPLSFAGLSTLNTLYLQDNNFTGAIDVLAKLPLSDLDISNNSFSGWIPSELKKFPASRFSANSFSTSPAPPPPPPFSSPPPASVNATNSSSPPARTSTTATTKTAKQSSVSGGYFTVAKIVAIAVAGLLTVVVVVLVIAFLATKRQRSKKEDLYDTQSSWRPSWKVEQKQSVVLVEEQKEPEPPTISPLKSSESFDMSLEFAALKPPPIPDILKIGKSESSNLSADLNVKNKKIQAVCYSVADLQVATESFAETNLISTGTLGKVYRAEMQNGQVVAVKKLDYSMTRMTDADFEDFLFNMSHLHHVNITPLMGYCIEHGHHLLVYEYIVNGTLYDNLQSEMKQRLQWKSRVEIALGVAKALEYLHEEFEPPVVHRNLTSTNILLDDNLLPRLSDCGLAKFFELEQPRPGYSAPEFEQSGIYRSESDIYSFGVVMLELLTGRKAFDSSRPRSEQSLVKWLHRQELHDINCLGRILDPAIDRTYSKKSLSLFVDVIIKCTQDEPEFRPFPSVVVQDLEKIIQCHSS